MNNKIRQLLIERACKRSARPISYGEVARELGVSTDSAAGREELSRVLGDISVFEHKNGRPLLSAIVTYNLDNRSANNTRHGSGDDLHGVGLYNIAEELGLGSKSKLQREYFGISEMKRCFDFWQKEDNYRAYADISLGFFTKEEIDRFATVVDQAYQSEDAQQQTLKAEVIDPLWEKTAYWAEAVVSQLPGFTYKLKRSWLQLRGETQVFKYYTWARIVREQHDSRSVYFTVEADGRNKGLVYKLDYQFSGTTELNARQQQIIDYEIPKTARWNIINPNQISEYNWERLVKETVEFIRQYLTDYDRLHQLIANSEDPSTQLVLQDQLIPTDRPDGWAEAPEYKPTFTPKTTDYEKQARELKNLGDSGEDLVIRCEVNFLIAKGCTENAKKVKKVEDGKGYDIISWDENGRPIYIEVKTTKGDIHTPFYLSRNELEFAKLHPDNYRIYRLYGYDPVLNSARYYVLSEVAKTCIYTPTAYEVFPKQQPS